MTRVQNTDGEQNLPVYWQSDYFTESSAYNTILFFALVGIIYAAILIYVWRLRNNVEEELVQKTHKNDHDQNKMKRNFNSQTYNQQDLGLLQPDHQTQFIRISEHIHEAVMQIFLSQSLYMVFFAILLICLTSYWFMPTVKSALVCILAFCMGVCIGAFIAFITMKFSTTCIPKMVIEGNEIKSDPVNYAYIAGSLIATLSFSVLILVFVTMVYVARTSWTADGEDGYAIHDDGEGHQIRELLNVMTPAMYQNMAHSISAFGVGICFACLFYREAAGQSAKGVLVGAEIIGKVGDDPETFDYGQGSYFYQQNFEKDPKRVIDRNLGMAQIICNSITSNLIPMMDSIAVTTALLCYILIIFSKVDKFIGEKHYALYAACWFIALSVPICAGISWIVRSKADDEDELAKDTAKSVMIQLIIANSVLFLLFLIWPRYCFPRSFQVGDIDDNKNWATSRIWHGDVVWCLSIGLILQTVLLVLGEYITSNYFSPARNTANDLKKKISLGLMTSYIFTNNAHFFIMFLIGFSILLAYIIGGFIGIGLTGLGVVCTPVTLLAINFLGGLSSGSQKLAELSNLNLQLVDKLYKIVWPSRNYGIFIQIVNMSGLFFANVTGIGCALILGKILQLNIWQGFTLFGFLIGAGACYLLRAGSVSTCKAICEELLDEKDGYKQLQEENEQIVGKEQLIDKEQKFTQFIQSKFDIGILRVCIQISILILSIILMGKLLGGNCLIGYLLGLNLVGLNMMVQQILLGNSIKSAKQFNDNRERQLNEEQKSNNKCAYFYALGIEQVPGSSLISYLAFASMFVILGILAYSATGGGLKEYIEERASYFPGRTTQWLDSTQYSYEYGYQVARHMNPMAGNMHPVPNYNTTYEVPEQEDVGDQDVQEVVEERQQEGEQQGQAVQEQVEQQDQQDAQETQQDNNNDGEDGQQDNSAAFLFLQLRGNKKINY